MDVSHDAIAEVQTQEHHVLDRFLDKALSSGAYIRGSSAEHIENLGDIVRCKAPQCIFITADPAKVHSLGVHVIDVTKFSRENKIAYVVHGWVVFHQMANHQNTIADF